MVKLNNKENDAEMMKPAEVSDSENIEDSEAPAKEKTEKEGEAEAPKEGEATAAKESNDDAKDKDKKMEDEQELIEEVPP